MKPTKEEIFELLDNAMLNGAFEPFGGLHGYSVEAIAEDMQYCTDIKYEIEDIVPLVEEWMKDEIQTFS